MVVNNTSKRGAAAPLDKRMDSLEQPRLQQSQGKGARRKGRFKGSDGSTSSDTTTNSFVRQADGGEPLKELLILRSAGAAW
ncbi:hypothetical protein EYF80_031837 [Liparis tanakae]|uniref:Uncharacterized protein n=1 Tax=Liparis tanakae TaxID=230148 RepID=A0A4Z2GX83_9TELE|nr:hypothetical protein EYF80_031837 [Liparis tanakae]